MPIRKMRFITQPSKGRFVADQQQRTAWHPMLQRLVLQRSPGDFEVRPEVPLANTRPQLDLLLLRRREGPTSHRAAHVLRGLWGRIDEVMVLEFKSASRAGSPG